MISFKSLIRNFYLACLLLLIAIGPSFGIAHSAAAEPNDPSSLSDRIINSIIEDTYGSLWVGTTLGGLNRYDRLTGLFTQLVHDPDKPDSLGGNCIRALQIDKTGVLWVGSDGGLDVLDPQQGTFLDTYP